MISPAPVSTSVNLKKVGKCWSFDSEIALEDFLWKNLFYLLDLVPFKRQFSIDGQVCDILALNYDNQLSILELKNTEDRYVVNQLTRYYAALIEQKPFHEQIDYSKPVRLIAVAPKFHKDNYSDQKYSLLDIELIRFELSQVDSFVFFEIEHEERLRKLKLIVPQASDVVIPSPPRVLLNLLSKVSEEERQNALRTREKILKFDRRIKEITGSSSVCYGSGKTKLCAEYRFDNERNKLAIFLWLPHVTSRCPTAKKITARMRIWTNWFEVTDVGHIPEGLGRKISFQEWKNASIRPLNKLLPSGKNRNPKERYFDDPEYREKFVERHRYLRLDPHYKSGLALPIIEYMKLLGESESLDSFENLINLSLKTWLERLK
jgi:RecB family endonuclease NucS